MTFEDQQQATEEGAIAEAEETPEAASAEEQPEAAPESSEEGSDEDTAADEE